jgi:hypothetical protein
MPRIEVNNDQDAVIARDGAFRVGDDQIVIARNEPKIPELVECTVLPPDAV